MWETFAQKPKFLGCNRSQHCCAVPIIWLELDNMNWLTWGDCCKEICKHLGRFVERGANVGAWKIVMEWTTLVHSTRTRLLQNKMLVSSCCIPSLSCGKQEPLSWPGSRDNQPPRCRLIHFLPSKPSGIKNKCRSMTWLLDRAAGSGVERFQMLESLFLFLVLMRGGRQCWRTCHQSPPYQ